MRFLYFVLLVIVVLLLVVLIAKGSEESVDHDSIRVMTTGSGTPPGEWLIKPTATTITATTTTLPRARTAPSKRTTVHTSSVGAAASVVVDGTNWTNNRVAPPAGHWSGAINGSPCGGADIPSCRRIWIESKGSPTAYNRTGCGGRSCGGVAQFDPVTFIPGCTVAKWNNHTCGAYNGYQFAHLAPVDVQYTRMREVYAHGAGCGHWGSAECVGVR